jgi:hypothetical protein
MLKEAMRKQREDREASADIAERRDVRMSRQRKLMHTKELHKVFVAFLLIIAIISAGLCAFLRFLHSYSL